MNTTLSKLIKITSLITALLTISVAFAANSNWTETFKIIGGHTISHSPEKVCLDRGMCAYYELNYNGLVVRTDMSRPEFVQALLNSGMYPA